MNSRNPAISIWPTGPGDEQGSTTLSSREPIFSILYNFHRRFGSRTAFLFLLEPGGLRSFIDRNFLLFGPPQTPSAKLTSSHSDSMGGLRARSSAARPRVQRRSR